MRDSSSALVFREGIRVVESIICKVETSADTFRQELGALLAGLVEFAANSGVKWDVKRSTAMLLKGAGSPISSVSFLSAILAVLE